MLTFAKYLNIPTLLLYNIINSFKCAIQFETKKLIAKVIGAATRKYQQFGEI